MDAMRLGGATTDTISSETLRDACAVEVCRQCGITAPACYVCQIEMARARLVHGGPTVASMELARLRRLQAELARECACLAQRTRRTSGALERTADDAG